MVKPTVSGVQVQGKKFKTVASYIAYLLQLPIKTNEQQRLKAINSDDKAVIQLGSSEIQSLFAGIQQKMSIKLLERKSRSARMIWYNTISGTFSSPGRHKLMNNDSIESNKRDSLNAVTRKLKMTAEQREDFKAWFNGTKLVFKNRQGNVVPKSNRALKTGRRYLKCYKDGELNRKLLNKEFCKEAPDGHTVLHDGFTSISKIYFDEDGKLIPTKTVKTVGILPQKAKFNKFALPTERIQTGDNIGKLLSKYN